MTRKIVKRSTFFAPHCPSLCSQILKHCHLNPFWPKKAKIVCSGGSWIVGFTNSIGGADVENIETFGSTFCGRNYLLRFLEYSLGIYLFCFAPCNISFLTQASSPIHFCSKSRLPTRSKGRERYPAAILKRSLGKGSLDGQQAHTDGTVHVLYMSIVDTIKNVPLSNSRVEFFTAFSAFALFFCVHQSYFGIQIC